MKDNSSIHKEIFLYNTDNIKNYGNLEEYKVCIKEIVICNSIMVNYINIDITTFFDDNAKIHIFYSYESLFNKEWINKELNVRLVYRK